MCDWETALVIHCHLSLNSCTQWPGSGWMHAAARSGWTHEAARRGWTHEAARHGWTHEAAGRTKRPGVLGTILVSDMTVKCQVGR